MCAAVAFLVVQLIRIGWIDGIRPVIPGSMIGTDRVRPHHLIGVDWGQTLSVTIMEPGIPGRIPSIQPIRINHMT